MFNYLGDVIYKPDRAKLDLEQLPEEFRELGEGLQYFAECLIETRNLAKALAKGDLNGKLPSPNNEIAAPLKSLHSSLKHLTWQSQQVAKGDYQQRVNFMGDFATAFNTMIEQLDERRKELVEEIESGKRKTQDLAQSNSLFEAITAQASQWIVVIEKGTGQRLFCNYPLTNILVEDEFEPQMNAWLEMQTNSMGSDESPHVTEMSLFDNTCAQYFSVFVHPLRWYGRQAVAFAFSDVSAEKEHLKELENAAYRDTLTKVYNRHYGMQLLDNWLSGKIHFILCFVDMDNLKYVNDKFGHGEGDKYILAVSECLRDFSPLAQIARLGGDEFMLLVQGWTQKDAEDRLEEMRSQLARYGEKPDALYNHSMSYGIIEVDKSNTLSRTDLLSTADEKMYEYKRAHKAQRQT
ncbi:MAG: diguanylate cyclase [Candidatus Accumulibacter sp.]|jgi:diguanylate cyclase (GGDEF)-like protein|nr:diguanylate cyclase [Accumulibacter sp.]